MTSELLHPFPSDPTWRQTHLGRLLGLASDRFDRRVLTLVAQHAQAPLTLSRLARKDQIGASHIHLLRHLPLQGARLTQLAMDARLTKQSMAAAVQHCMAWGLVEQQPDPADRRARKLVFTTLGLSWLEVFQSATAQAEQEFREQVGDEVATVVKLGLEAYAVGW